MNIILFRKSGPPRRLHLSGLAVLAAAAIGATVAGSGFAAGYVVASRTVEAQPLDEVSRLQATLDAHKARLAELRATTQERFDALAVRVGQLNAGLIRLNALGRRITGMAKLDDGEFDFDSAPALGGPEEPAIVSPASVQVAELLADIDGLGRSLSSQEQQLAVLEGLLLNRNLRDRVYPKGAPVRSGWVSSYFGRRTDPFTGKSAWHRGVDFAGKAGTEVVAVAAGVVTWSGDRFGYGKMIEINHGNGYVTRYAHNDRNLVAVGDQVTPGQTIGLMGSTGRATGPNLHFEVWHLGRPVDPARHIRQTT